ncbi:hypothetical protein B0H17DRAFT_959593 [Mycena rosella]|uniref:Gag-like protein n=1 Tax=Mycena rosella TaxID=1033263 RepID=A0AAD7FVG9_MYCRO|nr:hypothetical protein B0H17DRAFT_959593 [Mycena rosella]
MEAKHEGAAFVGARKLVNGGVVFDRKDLATADWVKLPENMVQFMAALGGECLYRPRRVELIVEMVPVEARIEEVGTWRAMEADSGIATGGISGACWVKAIQRRTAGQRVAHLKIEFANAAAANHAIDNGIFIQGKSIRVRKSDDEPRRCAKSQSYDGHLAYACPSMVDVCGRCAAAHRTGNCMANEADFCCVICKVSGHGAVSRDCPVFHKKQQHRRARNLTTGYRYIPTDDPRMWATDAPAPAQRDDRPEMGAGRRCARDGDDLREVSRGKAEVAP